MKTTLDISDETLRAVKALAAKQGVPMREVVERAVRPGLAGARSERTFRLKTITTKGQGMAKSPGWDEIGELVYEGRGGVPVDRG